MGEQRAAHVGSKGLDDAEVQLKRICRLEERGGRHEVLLFQELG